MFNTLYAHQSSTICGQSDTECDRARLGRGGPEIRLRLHPAVPDHERMFRHAILATPATAGAPERALMFAAPRLDGAER